jgi:hypothetical protein
LRDSEHQLLTKLGEMEKRVLICLNKADWYSDNEQAALIGQIGEQVNGVVAREDILPVRSLATVRPRKESSPRPWSARGLPCEIGAMSRPAISATACSRCEPIGEADSQAQSLRGLELASMNNSR